MAYRVDRAADDLVHAGGPFNEWANRSLTGRPVHLALSR